MRLIQASLFAALAVLSSTASAQRFGNSVDYWEYTRTGVDLTRGNLTMAVTIQGSQNITIQPKNTVYVVIDMLNYFLNPAFTGKSNTTGLAAVQPTIDSVKAFRQMGVTIIWVGWGLLPIDLITIPPSFHRSFSGGNLSKDLGTEMGVYDGVDYGKKLMRDQYNTQQYGPLNDLFNEGIATGTDVYMPKNRLSSIWSSGTPESVFLYENEIKTTFLSGVNGDQCVAGHWYDGLFRGFDSIIVQDATATTSPDFAEEGIIFNALGEGFVVNSTAIVAAANAL